MASIFDLQNEQADRTAKAHKVVSVDSAGAVIGDTKKYALNEIYENGTDVYFCKESKDGAWYIMKIDTDSVFTHATVTNNPTVTSYADARTAVTTLTYETYNNAF